MMRKARSVGVQLCSRSVRCFRLAGVIPDLAFLCSRDKRDLIIFPAGTRESLFREYMIVRRFFKRASPMLYSSRRTEWQTCLRVHTYSGPLDAACQPQGQGLFARVTLDKGVAMRFAKPNQIV